MKKKLSDDGTITNGYATKHQFKLGRKKSKRQYWTRTSAIEKYHNKKYSKIRRK